MKHPLLQVAALFSSLAFIASIYLLRDAPTEDFPKPLPAPSSLSTRSRCVRTEPSEPLFRRESPPKQQVNLRHIEGGGIGYSKGYSSLDLFFSSSFGSWIPFFCASGHLLNAGEPAANTGLGFRYQKGFRTWGMNSFYDYRKTPHLHYNQIGLGFESLGQVWDFRLNGYLPVGQKSRTSSSGSFWKFQGHHLLLASRRESAMKGANAEVGILLKALPNARLYAAMGPYCLFGEGKSAIGGEGRLSATCFDHIQLEVRSSYDSLFHGIFQGSISLLFPFGPLPKKPHCATSLRSYAYEQKLRETVSRHEIIPIQYVRKQNIAINPITQAPYEFWFVNNESHSAGTFESPFPSLAQAEKASAAHDVIYVFPGDGSIRGLNTGLLMKENQKLFGSGMAQELATTRGIITIPQFTDTPPAITLDTAPALPRGIVHLENNCEVSGMILLSSSSFSGSIVAGILGGEASISGSSQIGAGHPLLHNNIISGDYGIAGIYLHNSPGISLIQKNALSNISSPATGYGAFFLDEIPSITSKTLLFLHNSIESTKQQNVMVHSSALDSSFTFVGNKLLSAGNAGVTFLAQGSGCAQFRDNRVENAANDAFQLITAPPGSLRALLQGNTTTNTQGTYSFYLEGGAASPLCATIQFNQNDKKTFCNQTLNSSILQLEPVIHNTHNSVEGPYTPVPEGTCTCSLSTTATK